ncbi:DUF4377 domain-containing protein [Alkalimonas amylolytica]|uniref:DUF4377 domain-containing protein n=1 Tax=Alkalimonas amylolytica TaxID=152573 RepID=A0A1H4E5M3_ALKAM|nr:DUF4377 domain-containing protein [Alkalimonas amylolytica]SEA80137.1 hypothetical protein SAMN04488051_106223 [Alkalimonas amylolytica]
MKDHFTRLLLLSCSLLLIACSSDDDEFGKVETFVSQRTLEFGPVLQQCSGLPFGYMACFEGTDAEGNLNLIGYFSTEDFRYEWGYNYRLRIETTTVVDPRISKPLTTIRLLEPYQKTAADLSAPFEISLLSLEYSFSTEEDGYRLFSRELVCLADSDCILLADLLEHEEMSVRLEIMVPEHSDEPLTLIKVICFEPTDLNYTYPSQATCAFGNYRDED